MDKPVVNDIPAERARDLLNICIDWIEEHIHPDDREKFIDERLCLTAEEKTILCLEE